MKSLKFLARSTAFAAFIGAYAQSASAAPGTLSDLPSFLAFEVQPNIMIMADDSGSMDWEILIRTGVSSGTTSGYIDFSPNNNTERRELCAGYNAMMYDETRKYTPWVAQNRQGTDYANSSVSAALENPYYGTSRESNCNSGNGDSGDNDGRCDLIDDFNSGDGAYYFAWNDADNDGEFDRGECEYDRPSGGSFTENFGTTYRTYIDDLPANPTGGFDSCVAPNCNSQQNFANWYTYYRKREYVAKRALSEVISESEERMGLATINRNNGISDDSTVTLPEGGTYNEHQEVGTELVDVDDISVPLVAGNQNNKFKLLRNLSRINSGSSTPLRIGLNNVGKYFDSATSTGSSLFGFSAADESPILSIADGGECQQNFTILMSDGFWNGNSPGVGNQDGSDVIAGNP
ncbi:MAG: hypothetical protein ACPGYX_10485, partial [Oceanobacter sp.]